MRKLIQEDTTFFLKKSLSSKVSVSALAMTGTMFTTLLRRLMNSTSRGRRLRREEEEEKYGRESSVKLSVTQSSSSRGQVF